MQLKKNIYFFRDPDKQINIIRKQCDLYASMGQVDHCASKASILLSKPDRETILSVSKMLSPLVSQLDSNTLELVNNLLNCSCTLKHSNFC